jgi:hypothetical protein
VFQQKNAGKVVEILKIAVFGYFMETTISLWDFAPYSRLGAAGFWEFFLFGAPSTLSFLL